MKRFLLVGIVALAGCDLSNEPKAPAGCFSVLPPSSQQPYSPILIDACTGKTWLLVKASLSDKPEDGYTYRWYMLDKLDFVTPSLTSRLQ